MAITFLNPGDALDVARGEVVVCIPVYGGHELFVDCLASVLAHTAAHVPILICDDASPDRRSEGFVRDAASALSPVHDIFYFTQPRNLGFPENVNSGFAMAAPADVVILNSDCEVAPGWLEGLRTAALSDSTVASVTALTNHGTLVSTPGRGAPGELPAQWTLPEAAAAIAAASLQLRPRLPTAIGHCVYVRRAALELVGAFDPAFSPGYGEEVDFSQRCLRAGLCHVVADDVFVLHHGNGSFGAGAQNSIQVEHEKLVRERYPYYEAAVRAVEWEKGQLARALGIARRALGRTRVLVDARVLAGATTGTQIHLVELLASISAVAGVDEPVGGFDFSVLIPDVISEYGRRALSELPAVTQVTRADVEEVPDRFDLVHRPFQVNNVDDLALLGRLGDRLVLTQQDLIGFHNPSYFPDYSGWAGYREITKRALAVADGVIFFSHHACGQALAENLLEPGRARVIHIGVDHTLAGEDLAPVAPAGAERIPEDAQVIVCLGTDFQHKNRRFALELAQSLRAEGGWSGRMVLVGPSVAHGSSHADEESYLAAHPEAAGIVIDVGAVSEAEKNWLLRRSALVLYPTVHEGFGLVPFEAADHDRPCLWAPGTSLSEVLPDGAAGLVPWDPVASAAVALDLMADPGRAAENVAAIRRAADGLRWRTTGGDLVAAYREICDGPTNPAAAAGLGAPTGPLVLSEDAMNLVSALPPEVERPLLALATHGPIARPVWAGLRAGYRLGATVGRRLR